MSNSNYSFKQKLLYKIIININMLIIDLKKKK